jgi:hypothetical protein
MNDICGCPASCEPHIHEHAGKENEFILCLHDEGWGHDHCPQSINYTGEVIDWKATWGFSSNNDPLHGIDDGPCDDFAPDVLGEDPRICISCLYLGVDHKEKDREPLLSETYPGPIVEPDYFLEMEYEDRFRSDFDD